MEARVLGGRYRLARHLARGGMAEVYVAEDQLLHRSVAVKILFPELARDGAFVERFRREARSAASLNHRNIVSVYDFGEADGSWFIVMEYVEGRTLRDIIRAEGAMDPVRATSLAGEIAAALTAAHAQGIVHRDIKPANVLIADGTGTVKVADFGIARAANARQDLTMPGTVLGTATYLSPEQAQGAAVDERTDLYSLGLVLYEMLTGKPAFIGETPMAVAYQQLSRRAPPPSTLNPRVPPALDAVVMKAMAKAPADRPASAELMRRELLDVDGAAGDPDATATIAAPSAPATSVLPLVTPSPPAVYRRRRVGVMVGLALLALALIAFLVQTSGDNGTASGTVAVPDVVGKSTADATRGIEGAGLKVQIRLLDSAGEADKVADQDPDSGVPIARGTTVAIFVPRPASTTTATTRPATTAPQTTATSTAPSTTQAPATTAAPTTTAVTPTTSIFIPTTSGNTTTSR